MPNVEYNTEPYGNDAHPDQIEQVPMADEISADNTYSNANIVDAQIEGGNLVLGSGDNTLRFTPEKGLWAGAAEFANAPFSVDMEGNLIGNSVTLSGYIAVGDAADDVNSHTTTISGGKITTGSITATQIDSATITTTELNFTPLESTDSDTGSIIGTINDSGEGIRIDADRIHISGTTTFSSGYDPSDKAQTYRQDTEPSSPSDGDLWIDTDDGDKPYTWDAGTSSWIQAYTSIDGGHIETGSLKADRIEARTITADRIKESQVGSYEAGTDFDDSNISSIDFNNITANNISANDISTGTLTGIDVISTSGGNDRIEITTGDYLNFYEGGIKRAAIRGATAGAGGIVLEDGDIALSNPHSILFNDSSDAGNFGKLGVGSGNEMQMVLGTDNTFYMYPNSGTGSSRLFTVNGSGDGYFAGDLQVYGNIGGSSGKPDSIKMATLTSDTSGDTEGQIMYVNDGTNWGFTCRIGSSADLYHFNLDSGGF